MNYPKITINENIKSIRFLKHSMVINGEKIPIRYELETDGNKDGSIFISCKKYGAQLSRFWSEVGSLDDDCHKWFNHDAIRVTKKSELYNQINPKYLA